ncbi:Sau3AI family type II restriction endonuclease [Fructilactobacillus sanfranciscensis]|uniref:DNA mismatch repair protein MutH n=1 Tax=Fructilactobacillus sanfranciscensis TaxID=1625 RepID=A0A5C4TK25_FRUSA|nr:Sau3AI family type II restriction endonuclease [Fructilactobacillus sanfranciscensis]TNK90954.1 DNA mismatch repair protein MutH [Fructilactobacillus sanfranciscensis]TNK96880.1 DNA mismatch repair protein MutH [Fructilactobacillus sanfranciscensis]
MEYKTKEEVHNKALKIIGKTQHELINELGLNIKGHKNAMGDVFEEWFGKAKDNKSEPDLGVVELKATPFKKLKRETKGRKYSAKERLVLNIIDYNKLDNEKFNTSHFIHKNKVLEIAFYEYFKDLNSSEFFFKYMVLYQMKKSPKDFAIIKRDWETIQNFVKDGKAEDLTESATNYLAACTKGANKNSLRKQPHSNVMAKQRAFSFKSKFMTTLLNDYVINDKQSEAVIKDPIELEKNSLEEIILQRIDKFKNMSIDYIANEFGINIRKFDGHLIKNSNNMIIRALLNLNRTNKGIDDVEEFEKAAIIPKTIQFDSKGVNKENMSLDTFKFKDLVKEHWQDEDELADSDLNIYFSESKFLFVVFQEDENGINVLKGAKFYSFPRKLIDGDIKKVWEDTRSKLMNGVELNYDSKRNRVTNNFIKQSDDMIIHVRPHAGKSSYIDDNNSSLLPVPAKWTNKPKEFSNNYMTKQSFWINNTFIKEVVKDLL